MALGLRVRVSVDVDVDVDVDKCVYVYVYVEIDVIREEARRGFKMDSHQLRRQTRRTENESGSKSE